MKRKDNKADKAKDKSVKLTYPPAQDIYSRERKLPDVNPDDNSIIEEGNDDLGVKNEKDYSNELTGDDLDIPGAEPDNETEANGNEDEENNYYSLPDNK